MKECPKCHMPLGENKFVVWKCTECGGSFKLPLDKLMRLPTMIKEDGTSIIKCSRCGKGLHEEEKVYWKCGICEYVLGGTIGIFRGQKKAPLVATESKNKMMNNSTEDQMRKSPNLMDCPDCGKLVSKRATNCPHCGCPLSELITSGTVRIKMPNNIVEGWMGLISSRAASVTDSRGVVLWKGQHGENASFVIDKPTRITINLGGWANEITGIVYPKKKYSLVQDMGVHMFATYRITEVDVIDAD